MVIRFWALLLAFLVEFRRSKERFPADFSSRGRKVYILKNFLLFSLILMTGFRKEEVNKDG